MPNIPSFGKSLPAVVRRVCVGQPPPSASSARLPRFKRARHLSRRGFDTNCLPILALPTPFLRAFDAANFDPVTMQRIDVKFDRASGKPPINSQPINGSSSIVDCQFQDDHFRITWNDGAQSSYSAAWVEDTLQRWNGNVDRIFGIGWTEDTVRSSSRLHLTFKHTITANGMTDALRSLQKYGILLITDTPTDDNGAGVAALAAALGGGSVKNANSLLTHYTDHTAVTTLPDATDGPLRTLYGKVWSTSTARQKASVADSAYGHEALPLHTDMTYLRDPPGLQIFTMVQPSPTGGASLCCDGFAAAERLQQHHPDAFAVLSQTVRRYRCIDNATGWHLEASGPVIALANDAIFQIRHNDLDRLPDLPMQRDDSEADMDDFYNKLSLAHRAWDSILAEDDMRLVIQLEPGDTLVVANQVGPLRSHNVCA
jgi:alpha-ketoglutarate-dependent taurine dioxygenase